MSRVANVNTTSIADAIHLGCRTMQSVFNADDEDRPFFKSVVYPEAFLAYHAGHTESHVPGRHPQPRVGSPIRISFPLASRDLTLSGSIHVRPIRVRLRGDAVEAMDDFGCDFTFFDSISPVAGETV